MNSATTIIVFDDIHKVYRKGQTSVHALSGITIAIERGAFWAITGPSGSGKSTMLNVLGCLDRPSSGEYRLNGRNIAVLDDNALSEIRLRSMGFVFQSFHLIQQLSVRENIELPLFYLGHEAGESAERACELAATVGLSHRLEHRPSELSGGEQQRVAIARALANDPSVILADEPTGNLDTDTGHQIMDLLGRLNREGKTIVMVTHEQDVASRASCRIRMRDGRIEDAEESG